MRKNFLFVFALTFVTVFVLHAESQKPNLVFILTDNHGAWTLGCYGNKEIRTPNIDRLAAEGMLFTHAYCANSVCSPSRATFLTGLIASQHGVHNYLGAENQNSPSDPTACVIHEFATLPKILSQAGYICGLAGKWHLGGSLQPQESFTYWFTKPSGHTPKFYGDDAIWQGKIYKETNYMTDVITGHAVEFLEQNHSKPFFLYLCFNAPYGLGSAVQQPHKNRHTEYYADKNMDSFPRAEINPTLTANGPSMNKVESMRSYAAAVSGMDDGVGRVMETLKRLKLDTNTLVIFAADQGMNGGHGGFWGIGDHSRPPNTHEALVRIPLIFRQPGKIPARKKSDLMVANYDFLPTVLDQLGLKNKFPTNLYSPGRDFAPALAGKTMRWENVIFHEYENTRMIRTEDWKLTVRTPNWTNELYDMRHDSDEQTNLIGTAQNAAMEKKLGKQLDDFFTKYAEPKYDLWHGGVSKAKRATQN